jgi:hypothetical protein
MFAAPILLLLPPHVCGLARCPLRQPFKLLAWPFWQEVNDITEREASVDLLVLEVLALCLACPPKTAKGFPLSVLCSSSFQVAAYFAMLSCTASFER